jgi:hypothetical protein
VGCGGSAPEVTETEVVLHAGQLDARFARGAPFSGTYMLFGGGVMNHPNAITRVSLAGLPDYAAKYIYQQYPDFHMCKSPGAPMAQNETRQIDVVCANSKIERRLKKALSMHDKGIRESGERVCVTIAGEMLSLRSVVITEMNEDITDEFTRRGTNEFYFVTDVTIGNFQEAVMGQ